MAKRKRGQAPGPHVDAESDFTSKGENLMHINTYEDVADSEDEFHLNRDKILLEEGTEAKRHRKQEEDDAFVQPSDEEVYAGPASESEIEDYDQDDREDADLSELDADNDWGTSKNDYFGADDAENEEEALLEEQEARETQRKRLNALSEADFGFDESQWATANDEDDVDSIAATDRVAQQSIADNATEEEKLHWLSARYPEMAGFATEFTTFKPLLGELKTEASKFDRRHPGDEPKPVSVLQWVALSNYLGSIAMYFALLTSTASNDSSARPVNPRELQDHDIFKTLARTREIWYRVVDLDESDDDMIEADAEDEVLSSNINIPLPPRSSKSDKKSSKDRRQKQEIEAQHASQARRTARKARTEDSLANLDSLLAQKPTNHAPTLLDSTSLLPHEALEKERKKKSLRFYTSQLAQKAAKRDRARAVAAGDDDLPYRERFRDRQERLLREAEKRGVSGKKGDELDQGDDDGDDTATNKQRELRAAEGDDTEGDENDLERRVLAKKAMKRERDETYRAAQDAGAIVVRKQGKQVGPDGRREIGFAIQKNKGLTPKRIKDNRNPRVKKRRKFEDKTKKLKSMKPTYKGGEGRGGYGGELTGIKTGLVRSTKL